MSNEFINALRNNDINALKRVAKSDLHNDFVLGGNREQLFRSTGVNVEPCHSILNSMDSMHKWYEENIGSKFDSKEMRTRLLESTIYQANQDGVAILEIGEDVWGLNQYYNGEVEQLCNVFENAMKEYGKGIELRFQIGISRHCRVKDIEKWLEPFWEYEGFYSLDLYGDEMVQPIENFIPIYKKAKREGMNLKAHVGEWGSADDVRTAIDLLELNEVQHGISAASSEEVMKYIVSNNVRLNITPTSNIALGRVGSYESHPIRTLYHNGVDVTINSDDVLIFFDSDVSKEYLRLYEAGTLSAEELNVIRLNGLKRRV